MADSTAAIEAQTKALTRLLVAVTLALAVAAGYLAGSNPPWLPPKALLLSPLLLAGAILGLTLARPFLKHAETWLLALVAILYTNLSEVGVRYYGLPSLLLVIGFFLACVLAWRFLSGKQSLVVDAVLVLLVVYGVVIVTSSLLATNRELADERLSDHLKGILLFVLVTNFVDSRLTLRRVVWVIILAGAFLGTVSVLQFVTGSYNNEFGGFGRIKLAQISEGVREPRIAGTVSDPNFYAQLLVPVVPLALYRLWDERTLRLKLMAGYALGIVLLTIAFTYSRGGALATLLVLVVGLVNKRVRLRTLAVGLVCLAVVLLALLPQFGGRLKTLSELLPGGEERMVKEDSSFRQRALLAGTAWEMFADHQLLGVGAGNFSEHYDEYSMRVGATVSSYEDFAHRRFPHSLYLELLAETGLAGLLAFTLVIVATLVNARAARAMFRERGDTPSVNLVNSIVLALAGYLTTSLFLHGHYLHYLWLLAALVVAARTVAARRALDPRSALLYLDDWLSAIHPSIQSSLLSPERKE